MATPQNHKEFSAYIRTVLAYENRVNKELLQAIRALMYTLEEAQDRKHFAPEINFVIIDELCSHIHNVLAYLNENYDKSLNHLSRDEFLIHLNRIQEIREQHFKGENWNNLALVLQVIGTITFLSSLVTLGTALPLLVPVGLLALSMMSMFGGMYAAKQGFNYSVASKLNFFKPEMVLSQITEENDYKLSSF